MITQDLTDWLSGSVTAVYNHRTTRSFGTNFASQYVSITIAPNSPYYVTGIPNSTGNQTINQQFDGFYQRVRETTFDVTSALEAKLGAWRAVAYYTFGRNNACGNCIYDEVINQAVNTRVRQGLINPFGPFPASIQALARGPREDLGVQTLHNEVLKFDGPLFDLPGGTVRAAFGGELQQQSFRYASFSANTPDATVARPRPPSKGQRNVASLFGELNIPVLSEDMNLPLVHSLNVNLANRYDHYSDFGGKNSPKIGATIEMAGGLKLRGNYGKSFRAPSLQEANPGTLGNTLFGNFTNRSGDPAIPVTNIATGQTTVLQVAGGNANLKPETATTYSLGADYAPDFVKGLTLSFTYYNISYKDRIVTPNAGLYLSSAANRAIFAPYIRPIAAQPATCVNTDLTTYSADVQQLFLLAPYRDAGTPGCAVRAFIDTRSQNIGRTTQDGIDAQIDYVTESGLGRISTGLRLTKILSYKEALVAGQPLVDRHNQINFPIGTRGYGYVGLETGPFTVNLGVNYVGSYTNNVPITVNGVALPVAKVPSWTTFDLNASVEVPKSLGWIGGTRLSLSLLNVTDKDPPIVLTQSGSFDPLNANPFGRIVQLELRKSF